MLFQDSQELWDRKIWSWVLQDLEPRMTVLTKASSNLPDPAQPCTISHDSVRVVRQEYGLAGPKSKNDCAGKASSKLPDQTRPDQDSQYYWLDWLGWIKLLGCWIGTNVTAHLGGHCKSDSHHTGNAGHSRKGNDQY
jgi:hypothetical protein